MTVNNNIFELGNVGQINKLLLSKAIRSGDTVIDATLGNGHDALYLAQCVGAEGHVIGFDVQPLAIEKSRAKLEEAGFSNSIFFCDSHDQMERFIDDYLIHGVVFNLGYLPKADKSLTTKWQTTKPAIETACRLIENGGFVSITTYPGHTEGHEEDLEIAKLLTLLNQSEFQVSKYEFINQINHPPKLYWVSKRITK